MSLVPTMFSDWWEDLHRPHRLWDQHFGLSVDPDLLDDLDPISTEVLLYRPHKRNRKRSHPFLRSLSRRGRGTSTVQSDKSKFQVTLDVAQFAPKEIAVKVVDKNVVVEAKHDEKEDEHGWISRQFVRKYMIPSQCDIDQVESRLSSDGILTITAPRKEPQKSDSNERRVKIQYTGQPALMDYEPSVDSSAAQKEQQTQQRGQQQQQPQQQQGQRGRKSIVKAA